MNNRLGKGEREGEKERKEERRKEGREKERGRGKEGNTTCFVDFLITECLTMVISIYTIMYIDIHYYTIMYIGIVYIDITIWYIDITI